MGMRSDAVLMLLGLGLVALALVALSARIAYRSRRPARKRPRRRSFERGRELGRARRVGSFEAALGSVQSAPVGETIGAHAEGDGALVVVKRKRSQPCEQVQGFLTGVFESGWAHEVSVEHLVCAGPTGGECSYRVVRALSASGAPTAAASIQG